MSSFTNDDIGIDIEEEKEEPAEDLEKLTRLDGKQRQVETRRSIEDFLWRKASEKMYEDFFYED
jgi:hypothetical protein